VSEAASLSKAGGRDRAGAAARFAIASRRAIALLLVAFAAVLVSPVLAQTPAAPQELDGQVNGKKARFVAAGDDVLLSAAEADRIGLDYRDGKTLSIGGTTLWIVTLGSVTIDGRTFLNASAGVVPSIAGYFAALHAHRAEAVARSRETKAEINGIKVEAYDLGSAGVLISPDEARRAGLDARSGTSQDVGVVHARTVDATVKIGSATTAVVVTVTVAEPMAYFEALLAAADKGK
jgi:predicted aspartyl protease